MRERRVYILSLMSYNSLTLPFTEAKIDPLLESQFGAGRLYATISSRPGQSGRADGYILEGKELEVRVICPYYYSLADSVLLVLPQKNQNRKAETRTRLIHSFSYHDRKSGAVAKDVATCKKKIGFYCCSLLYDMHVMFVAIHVSQP